MKIGHGKSMQDLAEAIIGWTVFAIDYNNQDEEAFTLVVRKGDKQKSVTICATDLGFYVYKVWKEKTIQHV